MEEEINSKITQHWNKLVLDCKRITTSNFNTYGMDLLLHVLEEFLTKKSIEFQYQVAVIDNKLPNYIGRSMSMQLKSKTSSFWYQYRRESYNSRGVYLAQYIDDDQGNPTIDVEEDFNELFDCPAEEKDLLSCVRAEIDKIDFYDKTLYTEYYVNGLTFHQIHQKYGITVNSIQKDFKKLREKIREKCKRIF